MRVEPTAGAIVHATTTLPFITPGGERYTSTLADPPGTATTDPGLIEVALGRGRVLYSAGVLEAEAHPSQRTVFVRLIRRLLGHEPAVTGHGARCVELTAFDRGDELVIFALNRQDGDEPVPVHGFEIDIAEPGATAVRLLPDGIELPHRRENGRLRATLPPFRTRVVVAVERG
jgi:hypothetical protein